MKGQVYRFLRNTVLLLLILLVLDRGIGMWLEHLFYQQKHGDDYVSIYLMEQAHDDILVLGSSRASHHYSSNVLEQATGMTCFNGGRDEMTITYAAAVLPIVYERYKPKVVILEVGPSELTENKDKQVVYQRVATVLLPFLHRHPELKSTISLAGNEELYKTMACHIYPYNSSIGSSIQNAYTHMGHVSIKGYEPLVGHIDSTTYKTAAQNFNVQGPLAADLVATFKNIVATAKRSGIRLVTIISPFYFPMNTGANQSYYAIKGILQQNGCEFYDFTTAAPFCQNPYLFYDEVHLNDSGAALYSKMIGGIINNHQAR